MYSNKDAIIRLPFGPGQGSAAVTIYFNFLYMASAFWMEQSSMV